MEDKLEELLDRCPPSLSVYGTTSLDLKPCWLIEFPDVVVVVVPTVEIELGLVKGLIHAVNTRRHNTGANSTA